MIIAKFLIQNKFEKAKFFKKTFLLANTSIKIVLKIYFSFFSNINIKFAKVKELIQKSYTIAKILLTINQVKLINNKKFAKAALD